jgi:hypothetical protein
MTPSSFTVVRLPISSTSGKSLEEGGIAAFFSYPNCKNTKSNAADVLRLLTTSDQAGEQICAFSRRSGFRFPAS